MKKNKKLNAWTVYEGSNGAETRSYCCSLEKTGQLGKIAAQLFRTQKASARAKVYRGGIRTKSHDKISYSDLAYMRKGECMSKLCELLDATPCSLRWGWGRDAKQKFASHVLYVDLPQGQVSFHSLERYCGPDYPDSWDGEHQSEERILRFCDQVARGKRLRRNQTHDTPTTHSQAKDNEA